MLESIIELGKICSKGSDFLDTLIKKVEPLTKKQEHRYVCKIKFDTINNKVYVDKYGNNNLNEIDVKTSKKYNYVGNPKANSPKWYCSSTTYKYFFTDTLMELSKRHFNDELDKKIKYINENFMEKINQNGKLINLVKRSLIDEIDDLDIDSFMKKMSSERTDIYGLYVLYIDDVCICQMQEYKNMLIAEKKGNVKAIEEASKKVCFSCGSKEKVLDKIQLGIKYYIQDKISFATNYNKNEYYKNFSLCQDCYSNLQAGEIYLNENLKINFLGFNTYMLPHFIIGENLSKENLDKIAINLTKSIKLMEKIKDMNDFDQEIKNLMDIKSEFKGVKSYYLVNIIFFETSNSATKIKFVIKDINLSVFNEIFSNITKTNIYYKPYSRFIFDLNTIYHVLPKYKSSKGGYSLFTKQLIDIINAIFLKKHLSEENIISYSLEGIKQDIYGENFDNIIETILSANKLIYFLKMQGCIKEEGDDIMKVALNINNHDVEDYIANSNMDEEKIGLFLLGCLVSEIASAQKDRGKPILNKINYSGMDLSKVIKLSTIVFEKLRQEKILQYNEMLYSECMKYLNMPDKKLNKKENLFYILTGYSIMTNIKIKKAIDKKTGENTVANELSGKNNNIKEDF